VALLSDLNSTNGTTVNNAPVQEWQLADGDVIGWATPRSSSAFTEVGGATGLAGLSGFILASCGVQVS